MLQIHGPLTVKAMCDGAEYDWWFSEAPGPGNSSPERCVGLGERREVWEHNTKERLRYFL